MNTKYVFLDVDGTLFNFNGVVPKSTTTALAEAQNNGHKMIICTGRQKSQIYPELLNNIKFDGIVASAGAYVELDGKIIFASRPTKEKLDFIIDFFVDNNIPFCLQTAHAIYTSHENLQKICDFMRERGSTETLISSIIENIVYTDTPKDCDCCEKIAYYNSPFDIHEVREILGNYFHVVGYSLGKVGNASYGEITFNGINKATGIEKFMEAVNAPISDSIAVGDSENDLEMLEFAGYSVCMGNGYDKAKENADYITTDIDDDGIYNAFKHLKLI